MESRIRMLPDRDKRRASRTNLVRNKSEKTTQDKLPALRSFGMAKEQVHDGKYRTGDRYPNRAYQNAPSTKVTGKVTSARSPTE